MNKLLLLIIAGTFNTHLWGVVVKPILTDDANGNLIPFSQAPNQDGPWNQPTHVSNQITPLSAPSNAASAASGQMEEAESQNIQDIQAVFTAAGNNAWKAVLQQEAKQKREKQIKINNTPRIERYAQNAAATVECCLCCPPAFLCDIFACFWLPCYYGYCRGCDTQCCQPCSPEVCYAWKESLMCVKPVENNIENN